MIFNISFCMDSINDRDLEVGIEQYLMIFEDTI